VACAERKRLWALSAGEVGAEERATLEAHLALCESCAKELEGMRATREVLALASSAKPKVDRRVAHGGVRSVPERRSPWALAALALVGAAAAGWALAIVRSAPSAPAGPGVASSAEVVARSISAAQEPSAPPEPAPSSSSPPSARAVAQRAAPERLRSAPAEELLLRRAQESIGRGDCSAFLDELSALDQAEDGAGREWARILRARCLGDRLRSVEADAEYRRYLREFPGGRYAAEARRAVAH